jgi:hypothetical protein
LLQQVNNQLVHDFLSQQNKTFSFSFWAYGFIWGWPRPVSSRSAELPGWRSPPIVTIVRRKSKNICKSKSDWKGQEKLCREKFPPCEWRNKKPFVDDWYWNHQTMTTLWTICQERIPARDFCFKQVES